MCVCVQLAIKAVTKDEGAASDSDDDNIIEVDEETLRQREAAAAMAAASAAIAAGAAVRVPSTCSCKLACIFVCGDVRFGRQVVCCCKYSSTCWSSDVHLHVILTRVCMCCQLTAS